MKIKYGKSYWTIMIRNELHRESMPNKDYQEKRREIRSQIESIIGKKFEFSTEKEALSVKSKIPSHLHDWVKVSETIPVSLGLGWC